MWCSELGRMVCYVISRSVKKISVSSRALTMN